MSNESTAPDLTPAEARAEVQAFLGEGWRVDAHAANDPCLAGVRAWWHSDALVGLHSDATTLRAAVDALFQAWRDAVRPWCERSALRYHHDRHAINDAYKLRGEVFDARQFVRSRVLKESDHE